MKIGRPVFKSMAKDEPDYISSDCALAGHHIAQGMAAGGHAGQGAAPSAEPGAHGLRSGVSGRWSSHGDHPRQPDDAGGLLEVPQDATRPQHIAHRRLRSVRLGEHLNLQFEDEQTVRIQIQEMLRIEKIFEEEGIQDEIDAYAPLVPDGSNWKATVLIEYPDPNERQRELARLIGIEDRLFVEVEGYPRVYAIADEDLDRENDEKTSAVHFVRFEFGEAMRARRCWPAPASSWAATIPTTRRMSRSRPETLASLAGDLKP